MNMFCGMIPKKNTKKKSGSVPVYLNVYDLIGFTPVNHYAYWLGLGLYHSAVEVHGVEYAFEGHEYDTTGVFQVEPKQCSGYTFRKSILIGRPNLGVEEVGLLIDKLSKDYVGCTYNLLRKNCNHFSKDFCRLLTGKSIPSWVNRLARVGRLCKLAEPAAMDEAKIHPTSGEDKLVKAKKQEMDSTLPLKNLVRKSIALEDVVGTQVLKNSCKVQSEVLNLAEEKRLVPEMMWSNQLGTSEIDSLEHAGDLKAAASLADEAQCMDLSDRYVNSECVKLMLQADEVASAEKTAVLFTKDGDQHNNLYDMKRMWYFHCVSFQIASEEERGKQCLDSMSDISQDGEPQSAVSVDNSTPLNTSGNNSGCHVTTVPTPTCGIRRKHHRAWTLTEVMKLVDGVAKLIGAGCWSEIEHLFFSSYLPRNSVYLKDKWRKLLKASFASSQADKEMNPRKNAPLPIPVKILLKVREPVATVIAGLV